MGWYLSKSFTGGRAIVTPNVNGNEEAAETSLAVNMLGSADAFGTNTVADGQLALRVETRGLVTFAAGSASFLAAATGDFGEEGYAVTSASIDILGAEISRFAWSSAAGAGVDAQSLHFVAADLSFFGDPADHRLEYDISTPPSIANLDGNVATFDVSVVAEGDNTFADALVSAFAMEDVFSSVVVTAIGAVAASNVYMAIEGSNAADLIITDDVNSLVMAGRGNDHVRSGSGDDWLFGGAGDDRFRFQEGDDTGFGGVGDDRMDGGTGSDWLFGGKGDDLIDGSLGNDVLFGGHGRDRLQGDSGDDVLAGGRGNDNLAGGVGDDLFILGEAGGDGSDSHRGGRGADYFYIVEEFGSDRIRDFSLKQGDSVVFSPAIVEEYLDDRSVIAAQRSRSDLVIEVSLSDWTSTLRIDEFFSTRALRSEYDRGALTVEQTESVLSLLANEFDDGRLSNQYDVAMLADQLSLLG